MAHPDFSNMTAEDLDRLAAQMRANAAGDPVNPPAPDASPTLAPPQARPAAEVWGQDSTFDFTTPSGAMCRLRKPTPEALIESGMLDQITRLPGFAQDLIDKAEGKPPVKPVEEMEAMKSVLVVLQQLIPMVVAEPAIYSDPEASVDKVEGRIYVSSIDLNDRLAIMNRVLEGVVKLDNFRQEP
jgi:hypothetical protein